MCSNNLIIDDYIITQQFADMTLAKYSRFRDYFWPTPLEDEDRYVTSYYPHVIISNILAEAINFTVIARSKYSNFFLLGTR